MNHTYIQTQSPLCMLKYEMVTRQGAQNQCIDGLKET